MIDLYLIVWTVCTSSGFCVDYSTISLNKNYCGVVFERLIGESKIKKGMVFKNCRDYPIQFEYCKFYGHVWREPNDREQGWIDSLDGKYKTRLENPMLLYDELCILCKKKRRKKITEEWEYEE